MYVSFGTRDKWGMGMGNWYGGRLVGCVIRDTTHAQYTKNTLCCSPFTGSYLISHSFYLSSFFLCCLPMLFPANNDESAGMLCLLLTKQHKNQQPWPSLTISRLNVGRDTFFFYWISRFKTTWYWIPRFGKSYVRKWNMSNSSPISGAISGE